MKIKFFRNAYLLILFFVLGDSILGQNITFSNVQFIFIDTLTIKMNNIYGFKTEANENVYFISPKYNVCIMDEKEKLNINQTYSLVGFKLHKPIILEKNKEYLRMDTISFLNKYDGEEVFLSGDLVEVDLYFSPNLINNYFLSTCKD